MPPLFPSRRLARLLAFTTFVLWALITPAAPAGSDPRPRDPLGTGDLRLAIGRLRIAGTALYVGAHPDDENTAMLAWLARGAMVRTAICR